MDENLIKCVLRASIKQHKEEIMYTPFTHGIPYDIHEIKNCCEYLQEHGYLEGVYFGSGCDEPDFTPLEAINISDQRIYLGKVTYQGRNLLENLTRQEQEDSPADN